MCPYAKLIEAAEENSTKVRRLPDEAATITPPDYVSFHLHVPPLPPHSIHKNCIYFFRKH